MTPLSKRIIIESSFAPLHRRPHEFPRHALRCGIAGRVPPQRSPGPSGFLIAQPGEGEGRFGFLEMRRRHTAERGYQADHIFGRVHANRVEAKSGSHYQ